MYPLGHLALAYLCYAAYTRVTESRLPRGRPLLVLAVASQLPDLVDKPLAYFDILVSGRSLGHSLLVVVPFLFVAAWALDRTNRRPFLPALCVGVLAHLLGDVYGPLLGGRWVELRFLLWPVFPPIDYPGDVVAPWVRLLHRPLGPNMRFQFLLAAAALALWLVGRYRRSTTD